MRKILVTTATISFFFGLSTAIFLIPFWWRPVMQAVADGKPADWIGFAGSLTGATVAILAAAIAWDAVQKQILAQQAIANKQLAIQSLEILIRQTELIEEERNKMSECILFGQYINSHVKIFFFDNGDIHRSLLKHSIDYLQENLAKANALERTLDDTISRRWISPDDFVLRHEVGVAAMKLRHQLRDAVRAVEEVSRDDKAGDLVLPKEIEKMRSALPRGQCAKLVETAQLYDKAIVITAKRVYAETARARSQMKF